MQRPALDADNMVRRSHTAGEEPDYITTLKKLQNRVVRPHIKDRHGHSISTTTALCQRPAQINHRVGKRIMVLCRDVSWPVKTKRCRGHVRMFDDALIAVPCGVPEGKMPMLEKQQPLDIRIRVVNISCCLGKVETGHDVRHNAEPVAEDFAAPLNGVRQIGQNKECCRVGMIDKPMRQIGMKQGFN